MGNTPPRKPSTALIERKITRFQNKTPEHYMPKTITEQNLRSLIDSLIREGKRVVGPKTAGTMILYEPLASGADLTLGTLPRRWAKETFFPLSETILSFEKGKNGVEVHDVDTSRFPET